MKLKTKIIISIIIIFILIIGFYYISKTVSAITGKGIAGWVSKIFKYSLILN